MLSLLLGRRPLFPLLLCALTFTGTASAAPEAAPSPAPKEPAVQAAPDEVPLPAAAVGFSKLLVRLDTSDEIGLAGADFHIRIIERMRADGLHAVGAENLVFGKDDSHLAEYVLGGTVRELHCRDSFEKRSCRIGIDWQLLDVAHDQVVYTATTRVATLDVPATKAKEHMAGMLVDASVDALVARRRFRQAFAKPKELPAVTFTAAALASCAKGRPVATFADDLLDEVVVLKSEGGFGSGFFVSGDGLLLTAAHVVSGGGAIKARLHDGREVEAVAIRVDPAADVALLRTVPLLKGQRCAALEVSAPRVGTEVYVAGAPASLKLAFSLTRGIVSGYPVVDGKRNLQTDAPISPGNSGGPIVAADGSVLAIVLAKVSGARAEGLAFGLPIADGLAVLGLQRGAETDSSLLTAPAVGATRAQLPMFVDAEDPVPSLDPKGDRARAAAAARAKAQEATRKEAEAKAALELREQQEEAEDLRRRTPAIVAPLRWGGVGLAVAGVATAVGTYTQYNEQTTTAVQFVHLRAWNVVGWSAAGAGAAAFGLSFVFRPAPKQDPGDEPDHAPPGADAALRIGPTGLRLEGSF